MCDNVPERDEFGRETGKTSRQCVLLTDGPANEEEECSRSFFDIGAAQLSVCESDAHCGHTLDQDT